MGKTLESESFLAEVKSLFSSYACNLSSQSSGGVVVQVVNGIPLLTRYFLYSSILL